jgi:hypothetical protein
MSKEKAPSLSYKDIERLIDAIPARQDNVYLINAEWLRSFLKNRKKLFGIPVSASKKTLNYLHKVLKKYDKEHQFKARRKN